MNRYARGFAVAGFLALLVLFVLLTAAVLPGHAAISTTKHNLSVSGSGTRKATGESEICVFCHAPHNTNPDGQLWNRRTNKTFTPYTSSTLKSAPGQPNGASLLCLSCHDGTIALGEVLNRTTPLGMAGGVLSGNVLLGTDLRDDHPISFVYDAALRTARGELADPATLVKPNPVRLDAGNRLQCTSCHNPHDNANGKFLVVNNIRSALCVSCHSKTGWATSDHATSTKSWTTTPPAGLHTAWTNVRDTGCESCHRPHTAPGSKQLLNNLAEETNCLVCHNGSVAGKNIQTEIAKATHHGVGSYLGVHDAGELNLIGSNVHVECPDCHNPHSASASALPSRGGSTAMALPASLSNVRGIDISGTAKSPVTNQYEICLRCHGDSSSKPASSSTARVIAQNNVRLEFQSANPSFHPVAAAGRSTTVPSLIAPWTTSSRMECTDCHNNNAGPYSTGTGTTPSGTGVNGPHGSTYAALLERQYTKTDNTTESTAAYALCYKCHNRTNILSNATGSFKEHNKHIVSERTPCNVCHDPHGISITQGTTLSNSRLINFDTSIVTKSGTQAIRWERVGTTGGRCYLTCHGANHSGWSY